MVKGYKFFNEGFISNYGDMKYEVGKTYVYNGEIELCKSGFHFSEKLKDAFLYYYEDAKHCCKVDGIGEIIKDKYKVVCSEIHIKEELNFQDILRELSENEDRIVRENVALNKNCPEYILRKLSEDKDYAVRENVTLNNNCTEDILRKLSEDKHWIVRVNVAWNENCPEDILRKLSEDKDAYVRSNVVRNENCPEDILRKLYEDKNSYVRKNIAINKNCPEDILRKL